MNRKLIVVTKSAITFVITVFILWFILFISALIPNNLISKNMESSAYYFSDKDAYQFSESGRLNEITDNYADSISLNIAWNIGRGNPFISSIDTDYYDGEELGKSVGLYYTITEGTEPNVDYTRYWHGISIFIRILSLFTDLEGIRMIGFISLVVLICVTLGILIRKGHTDIAVLLALSLMAVQFWNIRLSMEYQPTFILAFMLIPLYMLVERRGDGALVYLSVAGGVMTSFFDFLTTETVTILLPLIVIMAIRAKEGRSGNFKESILTSAKSVIAWGISYVATFVTKWTLASVVTGTNAFSTALSSVSERVNGQIAESEKEADSLFAPLLANLTTFFGGENRIDYIRIIVGTTIMVLVLVSVWYMLREAKKNVGSALHILCLAIQVIIRFMVLSNHSYLHCFFTHRAMIVVIFAVLMAIWLNIKIPQRKGRRR